MRYVSLDIESSGLDPSYCQILEVAAVIDDLDDPKPLDELPKFQTYVYHQRYTGDAFALHLNRDILGILADPKKWATHNVTALDQLGSEFKEFLYRSHLFDEKIIPAGKNFYGFDNGFLALVPNMPKFHHRGLDPAVLYIEPGDKAPPGLDLCLSRAGIDKAVAHRALDDALDVVKLLRHKFRRS